MGKLGNGRKRRRIVETYAQLEKKRKEKFGDRASSETTVETPKTHDEYSSYQPRKVNSLECYFCRKTCFVVEFPSNVVSTTNHINYYFFLKLPIVHIFDIVKLCALLLRKAPPSW